MTKKKRAMLITLIPLVLLLMGAYAFLAQKWGLKRQKRFYQHFDTSHLEGTVEFARIGYHGSLFKMVNDTSEFVFYPYSHETNDFSLFYTKAQPGDSIYKAAFSDTLFLITRDGTTYPYTFQAYEY